MAMLITYKQTGTNQTFGFYGSGGYVSLGADVSNNLNVINNSGTFVSTNFQLVDSNTYYIELCIDSAGNLYLYVNGILVWSNVGYTITNTLLKILSGNNTNYSSSTINFIELRNKIRTPSQIAQITNKLCLPCSYDSISLYTNGMTANIMPDGNIAFASSEMTGNNAYKAFDGNQLDSFWSTNNIVTGYLKRKYPLSFKTNQYSITSRNYAGVENRAPKNWTLEGSNNGSTWDIIDTQTNITFNMGEKKTFNIFPVNTYNEYRLNITANNGGDRIEVAELVIVNTEGTVTDIRSELPADAISLGRVLTGSSAVKEIRMDYQDGRREGAFGGNRRVFLGRKYFSGAATLIWDNPFGTRKVRGEYKWAQDANGTNEVDLYNIDGSYGYIRRGRTDGKLSIITNSNGVASLDGVNKTSGYIGCYAEVLEDDN
jgi:hypothetical protein